MLTNEKFELWYRQLTESTPDLRLSKDDMRMCWNEAYRLGVAAERKRCAEVCNRRAMELVERWEKVCGDDYEMIQHAKAHAWTLLVAKCEIERGEDA